jgi:hypothetical protein
VPPLTNTPPASFGQSSRSAIQRKASFSAWMAPAPSIHQSAKIPVAETAMSNRVDAVVGACGMKLKNRG